MFKFTYFVCVLYYATAIYYVVFDVKAFYSTSAYGQQNYTAQNKLFYNVIIIIKIPDIN